MPPIPGVVQGQVEWDPGKSDLVGGNPMHGRGLELGEILTSKKSNQILTTNTIIRNTPLKIDNILI